MSSKEFMVDGARWAAVGTVTGMDVSNPLWRNSWSPVVGWNFPTMCVFQKMIPLQLVIGNMIVKTVCECLGFSPSNNPVMMGSIVPILQTINGGSERESNLLSKVMLQI